MNSLPQSTLPSKDSHGHTACGSIILITPDTPFVNYHDEVLFFCAEEYKQRYESDPTSSCMAARFLSGR